MLVSCIRILKICLGYIRGLLVDRKFTFILVPLLYLPFLMEKRVCDSSSSTINSFIEYCLFFSEFFHTLCIPFITVFITVYSLMHSFQSYSFLTALYHCCFYFLLYILFFFHRFCYLSGYPISERPI